MQSIRAVLAPTDFSAHARPALRAACAWSAHFGATLHLLHVLPDAIPVGPDPGLVGAIPPEYYAETEAKTLETLRSLIPTDWECAEKVAVAVAWGEPVAAVLDYAANKGIDLIMISTHGRTGLGHFLLGSVAERIVREAPCPVLTIRTPDEGEEESA